MRRMGAVRMAAAVFLLCFGWGGVLSCSNGSDGNNNEGNKNGASEKIENGDGTITLRMQENGGGFVSTTGSIKTAETNWIGYSGGGFIENLVKDTSVVYTVTAAQTITDAKITIHYANWQDANVRGAYVYVNDTLVNENNPISLTYTSKGTQGQIVDGRWADSGDLTGVTLTAGSNIIEIKGVPAASYETFVKTAKDEAENRTTLVVNNDGQLSNIDYLIVTGKGIDFGTDTTPYYTFSYASENKTAGSVTSETAPGSARSGTEITVSAKANDGWKFECWSDGATKNPYTFELTKNTAIFAHFIPNNYTSPSGLVGYATITDDAGAKYTITGGAGAKAENKITIASYSNLTANKNLLASDEPKIITISGTISTKGNANPLLSEKYTVGSNTTIYGTEQGRLQNIEFSVEGENVIIRNMMFGEVISWDKPVKSGADDALSLNGATHVWVDHCEFQSHLTPQDLEGNEITSGHQYYSNDKDWAKDFYDGLLDIKNGSTWITISNCYFHDHWKACLCASGDGKADKNPTTGVTDKDMRVTFYGNYWKDINARQPLFRWGKAHIFNSYFHSEASNISGESTGINCRAESEVYIDHNYFENIKTPIGYYNDETKSKTGHWVNESNKFDNCTKEVASSSTTYKPPYTWEPTKAKENIVNEAGVGKLSADDLQ
ncbi:MAG: hypothetical protein K2J81_06770 [Treponemataceae bacterium]|nr:hypothetical protein [Treponemataceae bacterium]